jgi:tRNA (cmo5U34)-methyltransferase
VWLDTGCGTGFLVEKAVVEHRKRFGANYFPLTVQEHLELYYRIGFSTVELFWYSYMQAGFFAIK